VKFFNPIIRLGEVTSPLKLTLLRISIIFFIERSEIVEDRVVRLNVKNIIFYFLGFFIVGLGAVMFYRANFGAGPWDTVTYNLSALIKATRGQTSMIISTTLMLIVIMYNKNLRFLFMLVPILSVGFAIDFWDILVFGDNFNIIARILLFIGGMVSLPFGLALVIHTGFPAFVFDELTIMIMKITKKGLKPVRLSIELTGVLLGTIIGFIAGIKFGAVGIGSFVVAAFIGSFIHYYLNLLKRLKV